MRDFVVFVVLLTVVFFGVGEWRGWYLGVPAQTPIFVYKKDHAAQTTRRTINRDDLPLTLSGKVSRGEVDVEVIFEQPESFQTGATARPPRTLFEQTYRQGQRIAITEDLDAGRGIYRVVLTFHDATGLFRLGLPTSSEL